MYERTVQALGEEMDAYRRYTEIEARFQGQHRNRRIAWTGVIICTVSFWIMVAFAPPVIPIIVVCGIIFMGYLLYTSEDNEDNKRLREDYEQAKVNYDYHFNHTQEVYHDSSNLGAEPR